MTREEAKNLLPIIKAFAKGKQVQYYDSNIHKWVNNNYNTLDFKNKYRIKPKPKLRPYTFKELEKQIKKHGPYVTHDYSELYIGEFTNTSVVVIIFDEEYDISYEALSTMKWRDDGTVCGVMVYD